MSKQYIKQIQALKDDNYQTAYLALEDYCTGWRTLFNPKRWAIRRALKTVSNEMTAEEVLKHVLAAVSNISPISKLAAIFYVIDKNENDLEDETKQQLQNMIKMGETQKESTVLKLLKRYSAWGIVRFFTGELGNTHVKEVRALVK